MALDVGYVSAIGAGALSFLSPCVLPLVPPYLCYMAGVSVDDFRTNTVETARSGVRTALLLSSLAFVLGFTTVFVALGAGASTIGLGFEIGTGNADSSITGLGVFTPVP